MLTEADAERKHIAHAITADKATAPAREHYTDLRLPPLERARLRARGTIYGSKTVNQLFERLQAEDMSATSSRPMHIGAGACCRGRGDRRGWLRLRP
jgi:hypothetical protein